MTPKPPSPDPPPCRDPSRTLLEFHLNGSLEPQESATVRAHLQTCRPCTAELDALSELSDALAHHAIDPRTIAVPRRKTLRPLGLAALLAVAASLVILLFPALGRHAGAPRPSPTGEIVLDLGQGVARRSGSTARVALTPEAATLRVVLFLPVHPGARYRASVVAAATVIGPETELRDPDAMGRGSFSFPARAFVHPGSYELVLRVSDPSDGDRLYRYPFEVGPRPD
jgi:hypothetical protein